VSAERDAILALLAARRAGATICPSEAARALAGDDPTDWRPLMAPVREAAAVLADEGRVEVTQRGRAVDARAARGPVRVRLVRGPVHPITKP
jgi:hypothetical protein